MEKFHVSNRPNLFLVGAPKCGTTTLYSWLSAHPEVFMPHVKEPHYFASPYGAPFDKKKYFALYENMPPNVQYAGDASVFYMYSRIAIERIEEEIEDARYIVCIRNPREMALSLHAQKLFTGHERYESFEEAWSAREAREAGVFDGVFGINGGDPGHMSYEKACRLGTQLKFMFETVSRERVLVILLDDISNKPDDVWAELQTFLGVLPYPLKSIRNENPATRRRFPTLHYCLHWLYLLKQQLFPNISTGILRGINKINTVNKRYDAPPEHMNEELRDTFKGEVLLLETLLKRDLGHWK